jgi:hypothetical protein
VNNRTPKKYNKLREKVEEVNVEGEAEFEANKV